MPKAPIAFDLTRLITRLRHASPTGIDRVDLAYARHHLRDDGDRFGVVATGFGPRVVDRETALGIVEAVADGWVEDLVPEADPVYRTLAADLGLYEANGRAAAPVMGSGVMQRRRLRLTTGLRTMRAGGIERLPPGTIYLHTSHLRLDRPERFDWLYRRGDIKPVFFVHDLIPISHPEYGRPGEDDRHRARMATIARHARHVIVNSADVRERFTRHLSAHGFGRKPVTVAWLGVEPAFATAGPSDRAARPFFLVCGTIESRKNHLLLLNIWRDLAERLGVEAPRLVIVGRRGWEAESVFDMLDRCPALRECVFEAAGLTTHGLARLMRHATALLMPSFVEGYGLPLVEAAACGLPVVASDIPVHREIAERFAHFLDPLDGPGWRDAVLAIGQPNAPLRSDLIDRLQGYAPPRWSAHFETVDLTLSELAAS